MCAQAFDTLTYFEQLKEAGVDEGPARVMAAGMRAQAETMQIAFDAFESKRQQEQVTRQDLTESRLSIEHEIFETRQELTDKITSVHDELKAEIDATRQELKEEITSVRSELKAEITAFQLDTNAKIATMQLELTEKINSVQSEAKADIAAIKAAMKAMEIRLILWQLGIGATIGCILAKALGWPGF